MKIAKTIGLVMMLALMSNVVYADYAYSPVLVGVLTSKSFTATLISQSATNSDPTFPGTATQTIWFNSTDGNTKYQNATVAGANTQVGAYPACATPIVVFKNTGNVNLGLNIKLNNTVSNMVFFYNSSMTAGSTTGTPDTAITVLSAGGANFVTGLGPNNETNLCLWSNFSGVTGGNYYTWFNYTSS